MQQLNIGASSDFILWKEEELQYKSWTKIMAVMSICNNNNAAVANISQKSDYFDMKKNNGLETYYKE